MTSASKAHRIVTGFTTDDLPGDPLERLEQAIYDALEEVEARTRRPKAEQTGSGERGYVLRISEQELQLCKGKPERLANMVYQYISQLAGGIR